MGTLTETAPAFVEMAHQIVWCGVSTVDVRGRPRSRILHPLWEWTDGSLRGWIATGPTPQKLAHLEHSPFVSCTYWSQSQDTCTADCAATWHFDDDTCTEVWQRFADAPAPVGYDPAMIPVWNRPTDASFAVLRLEPWRLRVMPGTVLTAGRGDILTWRAGGT